MPLIVKMKGLKQFTVQLDDNDLTGVAAVALVEYPAIEKGFVALKSQQIQLAKNEKKQWVTGPVLIPDMRIARQYDHINNGEPFHLIFSADQIEKLAMKFHKNKNTSTTNDDHEIPLDGNYVIESWMVEDPKTDKSVVLGLGEMPKGTWMMTYKIDDKNYWEDQIMTGKKTGFSIEGPVNFIEMKKEETKPAESTQKEDKKTILAALKELFVSEEPEKEEEQSKDEEFDTRLKALEDKIEVKLTQIAEAVSKSTEAPEQEEKEEEEIQEEEEASQEIAELKQKLEKAEAKLKAKPSTTTVEKTAVTSNGKDERRTWEKHLDRAKKMKDFNYN